MGSEVWGPNGWKFMHSIAAFCPLLPNEEERIHYKTFFESLQHVLPCKACSESYKKNLKVLPLTDEILKTRETILHWTIDIHNLVNKELNKRVYTKEESLRLIFSNFSSTPIKPTLNMNMDMSYGLEKETTSSNLDMSYMGMPLMPFNTNVIDMSEYSKE
jgi:hypothetical protein